MHSKLRNHLILFCLLLLPLKITIVQGAILINDTLVTDSLSSSSNFSEFSFAKAKPIIDFGKKYLGKPYRYRLPNGNFLDCSGFVSHIYAQEGIHLPHSSASIATLTEKIKFSDIKKGDLLFFKGRNTKSSRVGHVAMVVSVDSNYIEMMHSSCSRGVMIEKYCHGNKYYTSRFLFAGRLPQNLLQNTTINDSTNIVADSSLTSEKVIENTQNPENVHHKNIEFHSINAICRQLQMQGIEPPKIKLTSNP
ncbi:MAG: C40 family peptidase [Bacteroidales bacterium]|nr:C40 family peptidase [Bacteroidales bacterium]